VTGLVVGHSRGNSMQAAVRLRDSVSEV